MMLPMTNATRLYQLQLKMDEQEGLGSTLRCGESFTMHFSSACMRRTQRLM